jgi:plastocyanin
MKRSILIAAAASLIAIPAALRANVTPPPPTTHDVRMVQEGQTYRFQPASLTIRSGDRVRFINVSGGPHNASFDPATVPAAAKAALSAGMPNQIQELWGPLLTEANASYTVSFANVPAGHYQFFCMPHMAMGMRGHITVQ